MEINITDEEWEELSPENFETAALLRAVDAADDLRNDLNDGEDGRPPQLRTDLLKLHQLAMAVINLKWRLVTQRLGLFLLAPLNISAV